MFTGTVVLIALISAAWATWRISHIEHMGWIKKALIFTAFVFIWLIPILIRDRGVFSGGLYTVIYYLLYFVFIWNGFYFALMAARDVIWGIGYVWRRLHNRILGLFDFFRVDLLYRTTYALICVSFLLTIVSFYSGIKTPAVRQITIPTNKISKNMTIVALNDVHLNRIVSVSKIKNIVDRVNEIQPDMIVFAGDTVDDYVKHIHPHLDVLTLLSAKKGKYAVSGNHEFYTGHNESKKAFELAGITYLFNEGVQVTPEVYLAGIPDHSTVRKISDSADIVRALFSAEDEHYKVLLSHRPDFIDTLQKGQIDLQISGHTHGAQIFPMHILVKLVHKYLAGLYDTPNGQLYVSRGAGQWGPQMRFLAPSEITVINLVVAPSMESDKGTIKKQSKTDNREETSRSDDTWNALLDNTKLIVDKATTDETQKAETAIEQNTKAETNDETAALVQSDVPDFVDLFNMTDEDTAAQVAASVDKTKLLPLKPKLLVPSSAEVREEEGLTNDVAEDDSLSHFEDEAKQAFEEAKASLEADLTDIIAQKQSDKSDKEQTTHQEAEPTEVTVDSNKSITEPQQEVLEAKAASVKQKTETTKTVSKNSDLIESDEFDSEMVIFIDNRPLVPTVKVYDGASQEKIADSTLQDARDIQTKTVQNADGSTTTTEMVTEVKETATGRSARRTVRVITSYPDKKVKQDNVSEKMIKADKTKEIKPLKAETKTHSVYTMVHPVYGYQYMVAPQIVHMMPQSVSATSSSMMYPLTHANNYATTPAYSAYSNAQIPVQQVVPAAPVYNENVGTSWYYHVGY